MGSKCSIIRASIKVGFRKGNGKGIYVDVDGNVYEGIWKLGIIHGQGTIKT